MDVPNELKCTYNLLDVIHCEIIVHALDDFCNDTISHAQHLLYENMVFFPNFPKNPHISFHNAVGGNRPI